MSNYPIQILVYSIITLSIIWLFIRKRASKYEKIEREIYEKEYRKQLQERCNEKWSDEMVFM
jgi:hypothetical protein